MPRITDVDAFLDDVTERYCKDCERRKGIKNGKQKFVYDIGDVPCKACEVDDMKYELENAPTVDAEPVVRCKDCKYSEPSVYPQAVNCTVLSKIIKEWAATDLIMTVFEDHYCGWGERREDE